jgi:hypothetical protein
MTLTATLPYQVPARTLRKQGLETLVSTLKADRNQRLDVVMPVNNLRYHQGNLLVGGLDEITVPERNIITDNGVTHIPGFSFDPSGMYAPSSTVDQNVSDRFGIPRRYINKMRDEDVDLLDLNVNRWADKSTDSALVRLIWGSIANNPAVTGYARAILSDRYAIIDHLDTVFAILEAMSGLGLDGSNIAGIDLSENKLYFNVEVPSIAVNARALLKNYRSPFTGQTGAEMPLVHAGIKFTNSETGRGAFEAKPYALFQTCTNGATIDGFGMRKVHLGSRMEQGEITWSQETLKAANELVRNQVQDAVGQWLSTDFLQAAVDKWSELADVEVVKPVDTIKVIGTELSYTQDEQDDILNKFIKGGDTSAFGISQAITASVQDIANPDRAHELAETHFKAATIAAREAVKASA